MTEVTETTHWHREIASLYENGRWLVALEHAAGATPTVEYLQEIGAAEPFVLAGVRGGGRLPEVDHMEVLGLDMGSSILDASRAFEEALKNLPYPVQVKLDAWDPDKKAKVLGAFFAAGNPVAGREYFGARPTSWQELEDKTVIDALWDEIGIARAPFEVVPANLDALTKAASRLSEGHGTIQVADNLEGFNGGASHLRWVRHEADQEEAAEFFSEHAGEVRIMPFLEGVPCSIHGIVFDDYVAVLRPMEMVVFRRPESSKLKYMRAASFWDPAPEDREYMRSAARKVGEHLSEKLSYRGAFTIDGVMTEKGFRPTELNPRYGAALGVLLSPLNLSLTTLLMHFALVEGVEADWRPREFEELVLQYADRNRAGRLGCGTPNECDEHELFVARVEDSWQDVEEGEHQARVKIDPDESGARVNIFLHPDRTPKGPHVAPHIAEIFSFLENRYELGVGPLIAAESVR